MKNINYGYFTSKEVEEGIDGIRPIKETTLRNLRAAKKIRYSKLGNECVYKKEWLEEYLQKNEVQPLV